MRRSLTVVTDAAATVPVHQDRNTNVARMGWVAAEVVRHGGIAICSTISPFAESRQASREFVESTGGGFFLVHVSTSVEECTARDVKGLYQKAKKGLIPLTGVSQPYEYPDQAELTIDAGVVPVQQSVDLIIGTPCHTTPRHATGPSHTSTQLRSQCHSHESCARSVGPRLRSFCGCGCGCICSCVAEPDCVCVSCARWVCHCRVPCASHVPEQHARTGAVRPVEA